MTGVEVTNGKVMFLDLKSAYEKWPYSMVEIIAYILEVETFFIPKGRAACFKLRLYLSHET